MTIDMSGYSDSDLHRLSLGRYATLEETGSALAEIQRRQRVYESDRDTRRQEHDFKMLEGRGRLLSAKHGLGF